MSLQKNKIAIFTSAAVLVLNLFVAQQAFAQQDFQSCVEMGLGADVCGNMFPDGAGRPSGGQPGSACTGDSGCNFTNSACVGGVCVTKSSSGGTASSECAIDSDCGASNKYCDIPTYTCKTRNTANPGNTTNGTGSGVTSNPGNTTNSVDCPAGYEKTDGGLCIPKSPFSGGLTGTKTLPELVLLVLRMLLTFAGVVAVVLIIVGGFQYMTAGGNDEQAEKGKKALTNAIIGLVIVMLAFAIVQIITNTLTKQIVF